MDGQPAIEVFLAEVLQETGSVNTASAYRNDLAQLVAHLQALALTGGWGDVTAAHVESYAAQLAAKGYSTSTIARKLIALKRFFRWLVARGDATSNPTQQLTVSRPQKRAPDLLSQPQIVHLIAVAGQTGQPRALRDQALLAVMYCTGMRVSEVIGLKLNELDLERGSVLCRGRGRLHRRVPLTPETVTQLKHYLEHGRSALIGSMPSDYVFLNPMGTGLTRQAVWMMIKHHAKSADITAPITPHTLRHSRAAHMLSNGEDPRRVREWLGHANLSTTQAYIALSHEP